LFSKFPGTGVITPEDELDEEELEEDELEEEEDELDELDADELLDELGSGSFAPPHPAKATERQRPTRTFFIMD
jgi:hypothetical protein